MTRYRDVDPNVDTEDRRFVVATWSSSYKSSHQAGIIASEDWPDVMHATILKLIARPTSRTIVAFDEPDFLYGFIAGDTSEPLPVVYYVYVKAPFRSQPVRGGGSSGPRHARGLFAALGVDPERPFLYPCRTPIVMRLSDAGKIPRARLAPATARYANHQKERYEI